MKTVCTTIFILFAALGIALTVMFVAYIMGAPSTVATGVVATIITFVIMQLLFRGMFGKRFK